MSSVFLLIVAVLAYAILIYFNNKSAGAIQGLEEQIVKIGTPQQKVLEAQVFSQEKDIKNFAEIFNKRSQSSKVFDFLETITHTKVWFSKFELDVGKAQIAISGITQDFQTLGQQSIIFKNQELIAAVDLANVALAKDGQVEFTFNLSLSPEVFK